MKISDIHNHKQIGTLRITDLENFFNVYIDRDDNYFYNLNSTVFLNIGEDTNLINVTLNSNMYWPLLSYKLYGTTRLVWLLMKINKVDEDHIFDMLKAGDTVKYIDKNIVETIIKSINTSE